jgi:hypothetical protein
MPHKIASEGGCLCPALAIAILVRLRQHILGCKLLIMNLLGPGLPGKLGSFRMSSISFFSSSIGEAKLMFLGLVLSLSLASFGFQDISWPLGKLLPCRSSELESREVDCEEAESTTGRSLPETQCMLCANNSKHFSHSVSVSKQIANFLDTFWWLLLVGARRLCTFP